MNPSSSQFPTSNVKVIPQIKDSYVPERTADEPEAEYSKYEPKTRTYVKKTENEAGKEVFEAHVARPLAGKSKIPLGADSKTGGFGTAYSTNANSARQRAFNRAEDDRIKSTDSAAVKKHGEHAEKKIKEFESNPRSNAHVKNRPVIKINSGKAN